MECWSNDNSCFCAAPSHSHPLGKEMENCSDSDPTLRHSIARFYGVGVIGVRGDDVGCGTGGSSSLASAGSIRPDICGVSIIP